MFIDLSIDTSCNVIKTGKVLKRCMYREAADEEDGNVVSF